MLFDAILADTALEDQAAKGETTPPPAAARVKRKAVGQAPPANLPVRLIRTAVCSPADCDPTRGPPDAGRAGRGLAAARG